MSAAERLAAEDSPEIHNSLEIQKYIRANTGWRRMNLGDTLSGEGKHEAFERNTGPRRKKNKEDSEWTQERGE